MVVDANVGEPDARLARMEATMSQLEAVQASLKSGQRWLQWGGGATAFVLTTVVAILVAVVVMSLERSFTLTDRISDVKADTTRLSTAMDFVRGDMAEIKMHINEIRLDLKRVAEAVDAKLEENRTDLSPQ